VQPEHGSLRIRQHGDVPVGAVAVVDGRVMASEDGGLQWRPSSPGGQTGPADIVAADPQVPRRVWAAGAGRVYISDDLGASWRAAGRALPEPATKVRGIAANAEAKILVVSTNRGVYRTEDGGETWVLKEDNLPIHLEAGPLARDPADTNVLYAVYSLMPYSEAWRIAVETGNLSINTLEASVAETPFGGVKDSGYGREGGAEGLSHYTIVKNVSHCMSYEAG